MRIPHLVGSDILPVPISSNFPKHKIRIYESDSVKRFYVRNFVVILGIGDDAVASRTVATVLEPEGEVVHVWNSCQVSFVSTFKLNFGMLKTC